MIIRFSVTTLTSKKCRLQAKICKHISCCYYISSYCSSSNSQVVASYYSIFIIC